MSPIVVLTGGGIKGAVLAARAALDHTPLLLHVDYGQASAVAETAAVQCLAEVFPAASARTWKLSQSVRLGPSPSGSPGASTKNAGPPMSSSAGSRGLMPVLLSVAVHHALRVGASTVVVGLSRLIDAAHLGMPATDGRPDRPHEFLYACNVMFDTMLSPQPGVTVTAPLMDLTYPEVMKLALRFEVPLQKTWSCEQPGPQPCGRCDRCTARTHALAEIDLVDPTTTASAM